MTTNFIKNSLLIQMTVAVSQKTSEIWTCDVIPTHSLVLKGIMCVGFYARDILEGMNAMSENDESEGELFTVLANPQLTTIASTRYKHFTNVSGVTSYQFPSLLEILFPT
jgi:hypothetical protein